MLPVTDTIEKGRARLELPQISASIIYEIISDLKRFPLQSGGRRTSAIFRNTDGGIGMDGSAIPPCTSLYSEPKARASKPS
jgi:hypothetical protein